MNTPNPLLECVTNFSEGRDLDVIEAIALAVTRVAGQKLLHTDISPSANRTVITFAGAPEAVTEAAFQAIKTAGELIDMRLQTGAHPRIGATDVCPLIPLAGLSMADAIHYSRLLGQRVGETLGIPVYLYEHSAIETYRSALPAIRKGQYEGLLQKMQMPGWKPDYGYPSVYSDEQLLRTGATVVGARDILVAFNISLDTRDENIAASIARKMRTSGGSLLPALRAIGWYMADFNCAQVSMNLLDYRVTSPLQVWETCKALASEYGIKVIGCEVIGLIPEACITEAGKLALKLKDDTAASPEMIQAGIDYLGLDKVKPFAPQEKILEYVLMDNGLL
jgi:glutamate formiminotransferase